MDRGGKGSRTDAKERDGVPRRALPGGSGRDELLADIRWLNMCEEREIFVGRAAAATQRNEEQERRQTLQRRST